MAIATLKAPFPYFGGKRRVAEFVWPRLGAVANYIEPFCGSAAMLLCRPTALSDRTRIETINDVDCYVANFWRATSTDPQAVADWADGPVNEADLHARHRWLVLSSASRRFRERMRRDPEYFDVRIAGWWCWGLCCWIGGGWCSSYGETVDGDRQARRPLLSQDRMGLTVAIPPHEWSQRPRLEGQGVNAAGPSAGLCDARRAWLYAWFGELRDRLRSVRVCNGHWRRVCDSPSVTTRLGLTGLFLDPPYPITGADGAASRDRNLYASDAGGAGSVDRVRDELLAYCRERGRDPLMRIAICGYDTDGYAALEAEGWSVLAWRAQGGYSNRGGAGNDNAGRERIWFSPHCVDPEDGRYPLWEGPGSEA